MQAEAKPDAKPAEAAAARDGGEGGGRNRSRGKKKPAPQQKPAPRCWSAPGVVFESDAALQSHMASEWRRYNVFRKSKGLARPVTEDEFEAKRAVMTAKKALLPKVPAKKWWKALAVDLVDPITLEPLRRLAKAPFTLKDDEETTAQQYFDARALAAYLISSENFSNPLTRRELTRKHCMALDAHLKEHLLLQKGLSSVVEAFDRHAAAAATPLRETLRMEAEAVMRSLFSSDASSSLGTRFANLGGEMTLRATESLDQRAAVVVVAPVVEAEVQFPVMDVPSRPLGDGGAWAAARRERIASTRPPPAPVVKKPPPAPSRFARLAEAFGVDESRHNEQSKWPATLLRWASLPARPHPVRGAAPDDAFYGLGELKLQSLERKFAALCTASSGAADLPPLAMHDNNACAEWCEYYGLRASEYFLNDGQRYLRVRRVARDASAPKVSLSQAARSFRANGGVVPQVVSRPPPPAPAPPPVEDFPTMGRKLEESGLRDPFDDDDEDDDAGFTVAASNSRFTNSKLKVERPPREASPPPTEQRPAEIIRDTGPRTAWDALDSDEEEEEEAPTKNAAFLASGEARLADKAAECCVCLELLSSDEVFSLGCGHSLHSACFQQWIESAHNPGLELSEDDPGSLARTATCPSCRSRETLFSVKLPQAPR